MTEPGLRRLADWLHHRHARVQTFVAETEPTDTRAALDGERLRGIPAIGPLSHGSAMPGTRPDVALLRRHGRWERR